MSQNVSLYTAIDVELNVGKVIPLYKNKGLNTDLSNYRPFLMLPVFSKIFEILLHREINDFLDKNKLLNNNLFSVVNIQPFTLLLTMN